MLKPQIQPYHPFRLFARFFSTNAGRLPLPRSINPSKGLLLLRVPVPPKHWPPKLELASPLIGITSTKFKGHGIVVNAVWDGVGSAERFEGDESYRAELYRPGKVMIGLDGFKNGDSRVLAAIEAQGEERTDEQAEILVCTHGSRDCRCADQGRPLVTALRNEIEKQGLDHRIRVSEIAHVGGHKFAANAIVLPALDMLSNLTMEHAPAIIKHIVDGAPRESVMWTHWRGRYGHSEAEQEQIWRTTQDEAEVKSSEPAHSVDTREVELSFQTFEGETRKVKAKVGESLLEIGKREDLPAMEGVCGGHLECATCHLYIPALSTPDAQQPPLEEPSEDELDMLSYALSYKDGHSRLGCQIKVTEDLGRWCAEGGVIGLPRF